MTAGWDHKTVLHRYLRSTREALVWKLDGLSEREARWPRTPTGTNLLGLVKHAAGIELDYFGITFGRTWPERDQLPWMDYENAEPNADMFATADESIEDIVGLYRRVWEFADQTITELPLDAPGRVPWWKPESADTTLQRILVHVIEDLSRHAGHADIIRELHDHSAGLQDGNSNLPDWDEEHWATYTSKLRGIAERFPG